MARVFGFLLCYLLGVCSFEFYIYVHIHFEMIFVEKRKVYSIIFTDNQFFQHHFWRVFSLHCTAFALSLKISQLCLWGYISGSALVHYFIFFVIFPILQYFDYYSITVSFEVEVVSVLKLVFLQYCVSYSEPLLLHIMIYYQFVNIH